MIKKITCIACPQGCLLSVSIRDGYVIKIEGNKCPKGLDYARDEIEAPLRVLTTTVLAEGLELKMIPARTSMPIPKNKIFQAMEEIKKIIVRRPVKAGDVIIWNLLGTKADLIATRDVF